MRSQLRSKIYGVSFLFFWSTTVWAGPRYSLEQLDDAANFFAEVHAGNDDTCRISSEEARFMLNKLKGLIDEMYRLIATPPSSWMKCVCNCGSYERYFDQHPLKAENEPGKLIAKIVASRSARYAGSLSNRNKCAMRGRFACAPGVRNFLRTH